METHCKQCGQTLISGPEESLFCPSCAMDKFLEEDGEIPTLIAESPVSAKGRTVVQGHELIEELARGGMGIVYRARQLSPRRDVALKMLLPGGDRVDEFQERFRLEARALAELDHPSILPLYMAGEQDGVPFFTMKLALGGSLAQWLKKGKKLDFKTVANLIATLAEAVFYANQRGILHRDIKPGNILFDDTQHPFLADFGLAKLIGGNPANTMSMGAMGTPCYMAPEVAAHGARAATSSSDVYGLGAVLYELLAGKPPFQVEGLAAILKKVAEEAPEAPSTLAKGVPRDLEVICLTCLAKEPKKRYATAQALAEDLQRWLKGEPITARRVGPAERLWSWAKRYPGLAGMSAALLVTLSVGSAWLWVQNRELRNANEKTLNALADAKRARERTDERFEFMLGDFADDLENIGRLSLLEKAWNDLDRAYELDPSMTESVEGKLRHARLLTRRSYLQTLTGYGDDALTTTNAAEKLLSQISTVQGFLKEVTDARFHNGLAKARALAELGDFKTTFEILSGLAQTLTDQPRGEFLKASLERDRCGFLLRSGSSAELGKAAYAASSAALTSAQAWHDANPLDREGTGLLAQCYHQRARARMHGSGVLGLPKVELTTEQTKAAKLSCADYREAINLAETVGAEANDVIARQHANSIHDLGILLTLLPDGEEEGLALLRLNLAEAEKLHSSDSQNLQHSYALCSAYSTQSGLALRKGRTEDAIQMLEKSAAIADAINQGHPQIRQWALATADFHKNLALLYLNSNAEPRALMSLRKAISVGQAFLVQHENSGAEFAGYYRLCQEIGGLLKHREGLVQIQRENLNFIGAQSKLSRSKYWSWLEGCMYRRLAESLLEKGDLEGALEANQNSLKLRVELLRSRWDTNKNEGDAWSSYENVTKSQIALNRMAEALETATESIKLWREMGDLKGPRDGWTRPTKAVCEMLIPATERSVDEGLKARARLLAADVLHTLYPNLPPASPTDQATVAQLKTWAQAISP